MLKQCNFSIMEERKFSGGDKKETNSFIGISPSSSGVSPNTSRCGLCPFFQKQKSVGNIFHLAKKDSYIYLKKKQGLCALV